MQIKSLLVVAGLAFATALAGCSTDGVNFSSFTGNYNARTDAGYRVPAIPITKVASKYRRQAVSYQTNEKPGTIVVDTGQKFLYFVQPGGRADALRHRRRQVKVSSGRARRVSAPSANGRYGRRRRR